MSDILRARMGRESATETQKRRVMSINSGLGACAVVAVTVTGSRAMPQMGQWLGSSRRISGCIGQVYCVTVDGAREGMAGSRAMPHLGQGAGLEAVTSGSMGQR